MCLRKMSASKALEHKPHIVAIVGPTGSGKSQLAIDLARKFNGEVVNADVIQMYAGLDIASAKVTPDEMTGVPHHLMSFLLPQQVFTVRDFHAMAIDIISDIAARGRLPIVVGGTSYYVQSLLRPSLLEVDEARAESAAAVAASKGDGTADGAADSSMPATSSSSQPDYSYERLQAVDPVMARRLHPNDSRKIARALEVWDRTGIPYSQMLLRQKERLERGAGAGAAGASSGAESNSAAAADSSDAAIVDTSEELPASAAFATAAVVADEPLHALVIWTTVADKATHNARLDARVAKMMRCGLTDELQRLQAYLAGDAGASSDYDTGIAGQLAAAAAALSVTGQRPTDLTLRALQAHIATRNRSLQAPTAAAVGAESAVPSAAAAGGAGAASSSSDSAAIGYRPPTLRPSASSSAAPADAEHDGSGQDSSSSYQGLLQAIGYKEFAAYLQLLEQGSSGCAAVTISGSASPAVLSSATASVGAATESGDAAPSSKRPRLGSAGQACDARAEAPPVEPGKRGKKPAVASAGGSHEAALAAALQDGVRKLTEVTHRYARVQERFIRNRFLKRGMRMRIIDTSGGAASPDAWAASVAGLAERTVRAWLAGGTGLEEQEGGSSSAGAPAATGSAASSAGGAGKGSRLASVSAAEVAGAARGTLPSSSTAAGTHATAEPAAASVDDVTRVFTWQKHACEVCGGRVLNGEKEWADHLCSRGHAGAVKHAAMRAKLLAERGIALPERKRRGSGHAGSDAAAAAGCGAGAVSGPAALHAVGGRLAGSGSAVKVAVFGVEQAAAATSSKQAGSAIAHAASTRTDDGDKAGVGSPR